MKTNSLLRYLMGVFLFAGLITSANISAQSGYVLSLPGVDGNNSNVDISGLGLTTLPYTIEMWIKSDATQANNSGLIFNRPGNFGFQTTSSWQAPAQGIRYMATGTSIDTYAELTETPAVIQGEWHHLAVVMTDTSRAVYYDGVARGVDGAEGTYEKGVFSANDFSAGTTYLGWDNGATDRAWIGQIDEVRIWDVAKTAAELNATIADPTTETGLVAYYNFDDQAAGVATDVTGHGYSGTITGGTYINTVLSDDATLSELSVDAGSLAPVFDPAVTVYTYIVPEGTASVNVGATANDANATVEGAGNIDLSSGDSSLVITVTAENSDTKKYIVNIAASANLIEWWDGNGDVDGTTSYPDRYGWAGASSWSNANSGAGVRYYDTRPYKDEQGNDWIQRVLHVRWDGSGGTSLSTVFSYPVYLEACKAYSFTGKYGWNSNGGAGTYTIGINSAPDNSGTSVASKDFDYTTAAIMYDASLNFIPATTGTYYLTITCNSAIMGAVGGLSIMEDATESLVVSESSLEFDKANLEHMFTVSGNALTNDITLTAPTGITLDVTSITAGDAQCGVVVTATYDYSANITDTITIVSGDITENTSLVEKIAVTAWGPLSVAEGEEYYIVNDASGFVLGEDESNNGVKIYAADKDSTDQVFVITESYMPGEYFIKNQETGYLALSPANTWSMMYIADTITTSDSCRFFIKEFESGKFYLESVIKGGAKLGTDGYDAGSAVYCDKGIRDRSIWRIEKGVYVLPAELTHSYDFAEADTVIDKTGTLNGTLSANATIVDGELVLDDDGDKVTFDGVALDLNSYSAISMEYYYKSEQGANDDHWNWSSYFGASDGTDNIMVAFNVWDETRIKNDNSTQIAFTQIDDGKYHHVVTILTDSTMKIYRDGILEGETAVADTISIGTDAAYLGTAIWSDATWQGSISQFNIYDGELDAETISAKAESYLGASYSYLSDLSVDVGELKPSYSVATTTYEVVIPKGTASVMIDATPRYSSTVKGAGEFTITSDIDTAEVVVVSEDESDSTTYMVIFQALDPISGTIIGHESSWNDNPDTYIAAAFDGDINTYVDAPNAEGYVGYDFGQGKAAQLTAFKYAPRSGNESRMVGGEIRGANSADLSDAVTLYTISETPAFEYTLVQLEELGYYRYIYYYSADGYCNISELEMFGYIINTDCYTPLYPEQENLTPDPECTDVDLWGGWGTKSVITGPDAYCGSTAILLEDPDGSGCTAALDINPYVWQPNTKYRLHVMVKTVGGSIGFLASGSIDGSGPDGNDFGFAFDSEGEWMLLDTTFTTGASATSGFFSFNTCDYSSSATETYIDNYELYIVPNPKVAYVTRAKEMDATAVQPDNDPIIQVLSEDENLDLTVMVVSADSVLDDLSGYDVIVVQEGFGSGDAILKPEGSLGIASIPAPFIYNKMYGLRSGKALTSGSGVSSESSSLYISADATNQANDLFKGLTFDGDSVQVFFGTYTDLGVAGTKSLNYNTGNAVSTEGTLIAQPSDVTDAVFCINDVPAGTTIDSETLSSRMITFGMNFGAICGNGGYNMTGAGLTIWRNAVYMLAGLDVPEEAIIVTSINDVRSGSEAEISVYPSITSGMFTVEFANEPGRITVYNLSGKVISQVDASSNKERISINGTGLYIIKAESAGASKLFKVVKTE